MNHWNNDYIADLFLQAFCPSYKTKEEENMTDKKSIAECEPPQIEMKYLDIK